MKSRKNSLRISHTEGLIIMDRTFAKNSENTMSSEYAHLQQVRQDYPTYTVIRRQIRTNPKKESYKGLTYAYMEDYIMTHGSAEDIRKNLAEYEELLLLSECHSRSRRYPAIKRWFLEMYPEVVTYGSVEERPKILQIGEKRAS